MLPDLKKAQQLTVKTIMFLKNAARWKNVKMLKSL
jgi:hypothetical protein